MAIKKSYHKGWILKRLNDLNPQWLTTSEIRDALGLHERMLRYWLATPEIEACGVVKRDKKGIWWNKELLRVWLIAVLKLKGCAHSWDDIGEGGELLRQCRKCGVQNDGPQIISSNPPQIISDPVAQARAALGLPADFKVRR